MTSPALHSPLSKRISRAQLELLLADLEPLLWRMAATMSREMFFEALPANCDLDVFLSFHQRLKELGTRLGALKSARQQSRYRVSLDVLEAGLCITAIRAAMRKKGRSVPHSTIPGTAAANLRRSQILRQLENYERQLRRRFQREMGDSEASAHLLCQSARYRKAVVHELFRPLSTRPRGVAMLRRQLPKQLFTIAERRLTEAGSEIPPTRELRKLISQWLKNVRRIRVDVSMPQLYNDPSVAESRLIPFIQRRLARIRPRTRRSIVIEWSETGEVLRQLTPEVD